MSEYDIIKDDMIICPYCKQHTYLKLKVSPVKWEDETPVIITQFKLINGTITLPILVCDICNYVLTNNVNTVIIKDGINIQH